MSKKTIKINTEYFNIGSGEKEKTKKVRDKKVRPTFTPIVNPNSLKKQLLNKIKEHKTQEKMLSDKKSTADSSSSSSSSSSFSDEFNDSLEYLSSLSKKHKETDKNTQKEKEKEHFIANKTLKNYNYANSSENIMPHVQLDLPEELVEPIRMPLYAPPQMHLKQEPSKIPYGCLKNGEKPTFRVWHQQQQQTRKNHDPTIKLTASRVMPEMPNRMDTFVSDRERKLEMLKNKMKLKQHEENENLLFNKPMIQLHTQMQQRLNSIKNNTSTSTSNLELDLNSDIDIDLIDSPSKVDVKPKLIKRTVRRTYTLGKSTKYRKVGVLVKDKNTRKKIIDAQKDLKKKSIQEVKKYLKEHGLIKAGSNAPNDVVRKTYESAMLTGDIANTNRETLLHNLLSENLAE